MTEGRRTGQNDRNRKHRNWNIDRLTGLFICQCRRRFVWGDFKPKNHFSIHPISYGLNAHLYLLEFDWQWNVWKINYGDRLTANFVRAKGKVRLKAMLRADPIQSLCLSLFGKWKRKNWTNFNDWDQIPNKLHSRQQNFYLLLSPVTDLFCVWCFVAKNKVYSRFCLNNWNSISLFAARIFLIGRAVDRLLIWPNYCLPNISTYIRRSVSPAIGKNIPNKGQFNKRMEQWEITRP